MSKIIRIFDFQDYKQFLANWLDLQPKRGHGLLRKIADSLGIHTTMVTHVLKGHLHFSPEQTMKLAEYLGLGTLETECLMNMVHLARAGDQKTKQFYEVQLNSIREKASDIKQRLNLRNSLEEPDQAIFYSTWIYVAVRLLSAIPKMQTPAAISEWLRMPPAKVNTVLEFLVSRGLCQIDGDRITYKDLTTYLEKDSPLSSRHHVNWRLRMIEQIEKRQPTDLVITYPMVLSESDVKKVTLELATALENIRKLSEPSPSEKLYCLNIDWLEVKN